MPVSEYGFTQGPWGFLAHDRSKIVSPSPVPMQAMRYIGEAFYHPDRESIYHAAQESVANRAVMVMAPLLFEFIVGVAEMPCCETPGCTTGNPACHVKEARALVNQYRDDIAKGW